MEKAYLIRMSFMVLTLAAISSSGTTAWKSTSSGDWTLVAKHADVHRFVTLLNARRLLRALKF